MLKIAFLDSFFHLEMREMKLVKFMNFQQGEMSVKQYSLKFTQHPKYSPAFVDNSRAIMNKFVIGLPNLLKNNVVR